MATIPESLRRNDKEPLATYAKRIGWRVDAETLEAFTTRKAREHADASDPDASKEQAAFVERRKNGWKAPRPSRDVVVAGPDNRAGGDEGPLGEPDAEASRAASDARVRDAWRRRRA